MVADYDYDVFNRLVTLTHFVDRDGDLAYQPNTPGQWLNAQFVYTYDPAGNRLTARETQPLLAFQWAWEYDGLNRLVREQMDLNQGYLVTDTSYGFDLSSNRMHRQKLQDFDGVQTTSTARYTYDANDRLLTVLEEEFNGWTTGASHSAYFYTVTQQSGLTQRQGLVVGQGALQETQTMHDDVTGRLASIQTTRNGQTTRTGYGYNASGLRVSREVDQQSWTYLWDPSGGHTGYAQVLEEWYDGDGSGHAYQPILETSYTLGHRILRQAQRIQNWDSLIFLSDAHGSTRALLTPEGQIAAIDAPRLVPAPAPAVELPGVPGAGELADHKLLRYVCVT